MPRLVNAQDLASPNPFAIIFPDPRPSRHGQESGIIGFCHLGRDDNIDRVCGSNFLSNWFDISPNRIELTAPAEPDMLHTFGNAEVAFHALKFWRVADTFAYAPAKEAWSKYNKMTGKEDITYAGYGSSWKAMKAVLTAKFAADPRLAAKLSDTGDAFLIHHIPQVGRDSVWSDNGDGTGQNWLGVLLMLVRDSFAGRDAWTEWLQTLMDVETGQMRGVSRARTLQDVIITATIACIDVMEAKLYGDTEYTKPICKRPGCGKPTWNGLPGEYCEGKCQYFKNEDGDLLRQAGKSQVASPEPLALPAPTSAGGVVALRSEDLSKRDQARMAALSSMRSESTIPNVGHLTTLTSMDRDMQMMRGGRRGSSEVRAMSSRKSRSSTGMGRNPSMRRQSEIDLMGIDVNRPGILPALVLTFCWISAAVAVLVAIIWVYVYEEVRRHEDLATAAAVAHARFLTVELLRPAETVVRAVATGFGGGAVGSLADYGSLGRLLEPHFRARPAIHEVELAGPPEEALGSIHVTSASWLNSGILLRTDRPDCERVEGNMGCTLEDMRANTSSWYTTGFGVGSQWYQGPPRTFWHGPSYSLSNPLEVVCDDFCWRSTYAFVGRVTGGPHSPRGTAVQSRGVTSTTAMPASGAPSGPVQQVLVRAAMESQSLQEVVMKAEAISRGEAAVCTEAGDILALKDMAETIFVERTTGSVRPRQIWELDRPWAQLTNPEFVTKAKEYLFFVHGGYRVSSWKLGDGQLDALGLASNLRIIMAVPQDNYYDDVLGPLIPLVTGTAAAPVAGLGLLTFAVGLRKCLLRLWRRHKATTNLLLSQVQH